MGGLTLHAHRFRPPNALELRETGGESIVAIDEEGTTVQMKGQESMKGPDSQEFTFDRAFQMDTKQVEVFEYGVRGIVDGELNSLSEESAGGAARDDTLPPTAE